LYIEPWVIVTHKKPFVVIDERIARGITSLNRTISLHGNGRADCRFVRRIKIGAMNEGSSLVPQIKFDNCVQKIRREQSLRSLYLFWQNIFVKAMYIDGSSDFLTDTEFN
jgi:hypothetical protein